MSKLNIIITDASTVYCNNDISLDVFKQFGNLTLIDYTEPKDVAETIKDADIVLCNKTPLTAENMKDAKKLKFVGILATGYNNIDIGYAKSRGITVCNAGGYSTNSVAQHTFALLLELINKVSIYNKEVMEGRWMNNKIFTFFDHEIIELADKTMGLIGCGNIGINVAKIANAFNMKVLVHTRSGGKDTDMIKYVDLDTLLKESDVVSLHCPLNDQSKNLFNDETFNKMKDGAFFINTARGPIVDELALKKALETGKLKGAAIDVLEVEPMKKDSPLLNVPNLIITPHVAWAPKETRQRLVDLVADNVKCYLEGKPQNVIV